MSGLDSPIILGPGEGQSIPNAGGGRLIYKAVGANTGGRFGIFESVQGPRARGPELHLHRRMVEMFWVLEGVVQVVIREQEIEAQPGAFVLVPAGTPHRFSNPLDVPSRMLIMFTPGDQRERYFEGLAELARRTEAPSRDEVLALWHTYDQWLVDE